MNLKSSLNIVMFLLAASFLTTAADAQDCVEEYIPAIRPISEIELVSYLKNLTMDGDLLYGRTYEDLQIFDFSDPTSPVIISQTSTENYFSGYQVEDMAVVDHWLLVATSDHGIFPVDIRKPESPIFHPPFLPEVELRSVACFEGGIFTSTADNQFLWLDAESLPAPDRILESSISELTGGEQNSQGICIITTGPHGLYLLAKHWNSFYLFKLRPTVTGVQPEISYDILEVEVINDLHLLLALDASSSRVCISVSTRFEGPRGSIAYTYIVDALDFNQAISRVNYGSRHLTAELKNGQFTIGSSVYEFSSENQVNWVRTIAHYFPPFLPYEDKLICKGWHNHLVIGEYDDLHEPSSIGGMFPEIHEVDESFLGVHAELRTPFFIMVTTHSGHNWVEYGYKTYRIDNDGFPRLLFPSGNHYPRLITTDYHWYVEEEGVYIARNDPPEILYFERGLKFPTGHLYTDMIGCFVDGNQLILKDMTVVPPAEFSSWTASGSIRPAPYLFRDRYFICLVNSAAGPEIVILELAYQSAPVEVARISDFCDNSFNATLSGLSGNVLSVYSHGSSFFFDITNPTFPQQIPEYPYPGIVKEDIFLVSENGLATVYHVPDLDEATILGQIMVDRVGPAEWDVSGTTLMIALDNGLGTFKMPCQSQVPTVLKFFSFIEDETQLVWEFSESASQPEVRLVMETGTVVRDLSIHQKSDGSWFAVIPDNISSSSGNTQKFHLMVQQDSATWTVIGTLEKQSGDVSPGLEIIRTSPNPFNPSTTISFRVPYSQPVVVSVYDLAGRCVRTLIDSNLAAGQHQSTWDGHNQRGESSPSGSYFLVIEGENRIQRRKITLLK